MNRCTVGFEFRDEIRIHESIGLETVPTEQLVISGRDSHHGEPAILIGDRYLIKIGSISLHGDENSHNTGNGPIGAIDHTTTHLGCAELTSTSSVPDIEPENLKTSVRTSVPPRKALLT